MKIEKPLALRKWIRRLFATFGKLTMGDATSYTYTRFNGSDTWNTCNTCNTCNTWNPIILSMSNPCLCLQVLGSGEKVKIIYRWIMPCIRYLSNTCMTSLLLLDRMQPDRMHAMQLYEKVHQSHQSEPCRWSSLRDWEILPLRLYHLRTRHNFRQLCPVTPKRKHSPYKDFPILEWCYDPRNISPYWWSPYHRRNNGGGVEGDNG